MLKYTVSSLNNTLMSDSQHNTQPYRFSADLQQLSEDGVVIIKLGFFWHSLRGLWEFWRYTRLIANSSVEAKDQGLHSSEYFIYDAGHAGLIQYWRSFADLEAWACKDPTHTAWWKEIEKENKWAHLSIYHEVFVIPKTGIETVYNLHPSIKNFPGLGHFLPHLSPTEYRARKRFLKPRGERKEEVSS
jgi:hypothetical protein